ncbi:sensor histidine kinase [Xanthobacter sp. KR7-65]|uniref:sensor histidine kinase n=1 Tax=Xanthobacter sp. KR7-65 TaxID=3156612 RepID=UPI0032B3C64E
MPAAVPIALASATPARWARASARLFRLILAALACALMACAVGKADALRLENDTFGIPVAGHLSVLRDETGTLTAQEALAAGARFQPIPGNFNAGYSAKGAWWLRLTLSAGPGAGGTWYLAMNAPYTDRIEFFGPDGEAGSGGGLVSKVAGTLAPLAGRDLITHTSVFRLDLAQDTPQVILLRLSGSRSLSAKPELWRLPAFVQHLTLNVLMVSLAVGAAGISAIGALLFGAWLRNPPFAWYGAYVGTTALVFLANSGFLLLLLSSWSPTTVLRLQGFIGCLSMMTGAFMIRSIFCPDGRLPLVRKGLTAYGVAAGAGSLASAAGFYGAVAPFLMAGVLVLALFFPVIAALRLRRGDAASIWYFVGFTSYSLATFWFALVALGFAPLTRFMEWGHQSIGLLYMVAIFAGIASTLRAGARERRDLQGRLLAASRQNAAELEAAVAQRTAALTAEIAAREKAEAALHVALREQRNFLVMVSHEFRTPLAIVRAAIANIERGAVDMSERFQREAGKIVRAVTRLSSLIDTFLAEEWITKVAMRMELAPVDLPALAADVCRELGAEADRAITCTGLVHGRVEGDAVLLRTVVENLVGNALKHADGPVQVEVRAQTEGMTLSVTDTGAGIPLDEQSAIFERYYRSPTGSGRPGAGVGLHIVKQVVNLHHGRITLESARGAGSTFSVWLPATQPPAAVPPRLAQEAAQ